MSKILHKGTISLARLDKGNKTVYLITTERSKNSINTCKSLELSEKEFEFLVQLSGEIE